MQSIGLSQTEKKHIIPGEEIIVDFDDFHKEELNDYFRDRTFSFRPLTLSDLDDMAALYSDPEVMRYLEVDAIVTKSNVF